MSRSVVHHLILKDLYFVRWIVAGSIVAGAASVAVMPAGPAAAYAGGISLICVLIILNIFLVMGSVVQERKGKVLLFVLSLPISTSEYVAAKVLANATAFVVPWIVLVAATTIMIVLSEIPNGILPFWLTVLGYLLFYYCALLAVALVTESTGWLAAVITAGNVSINFVIPLLLGLPSVAAHRDGPMAVWTADIAFILAIQIAGGAAALGAAIYVHSRRTDFV